jgi:hypothetical protein
MMKFCEGQFVEVLDDFTSEWVIAKVVRLFGGIAENPAYCTVRFQNGGTLGIFDEMHVRDVEENPVGMA